MSQKAKLLALVFGLSCFIGFAHAQVQPEAFSYLVGLDPFGDNWVALRSLPSATAGVRIARLGPNTLFSEIERVGDWTHVRLPTGEVGWVNARYVGCCRTASAGGRAKVTAGGSCDDLWYQRNAIFKAAGFCFRSARGISTFGNAGCQFDSEADVPLSALQRSQVAQYRASERSLACTP